VRHTFEVPLRDYKVSGWSFITATQIQKWDPYFLNRHNSEQQYILSPFFENNTEEENTYSYFMQDGV
jgi:hypothetical protein